MGPRSNDLGKLIERRAIVRVSAPLQWGRDQMISERQSMSQRLLPLTRWLQWGRDQMISERSRTEHNEIKFFSPLQWGRDQMISESPPLQVLTV